MPKPVETHASSLPSAAGAHRSDASSLSALAGGQRQRRRDPVPPISESAATPPPAFSTAKTEEPKPQDEIDLTKYRLADIKVYGSVYDDFDRVLRLMQSRVGWRVNKTEVLTAIAQLLIAAEPTLKKRPPASGQTSRPPNQDHAAKDKAERELTIWLHRLLRDAEVVE